MYSIEIKKTGEVMGVECFVINQVYYNNQGERAVIRRLGSTVTRKAAKALKKTIENSLYSEEVKA